MRQLPTSRRALRFAVAVALLAPLAAGAGVFGAGVGCGPDQSVSWFCLNPATGKVPGGPYDSTHYVNGVFDPCHCYDPCGELPQCPIVVLDAGSPSAPGCDAGDDAGDAGG